MATKKTPAGQGGGMPPLKGGIIPPPPSDLASITSAVAGLSKKDRKALFDRLALEHRSTAGTQVDERDRDLVMFSDAISTALAAIIPIGGPAYGPVLVRDALKPRATWQHVAAFLASTGYGALAPPEKVRVYGFLAGLLVNHALGISRRTGAPLSVKLVTNCVGQMAGLFELEFPGYLAAGFTGVVARRLCAAQAVVED